MATYVNGVKIDGDDDDTNNTFVINTNGGNYNRVAGNFVQGDVIEANGKIHKSAPKPVQPIKIEREGSIDV